MKLETGKRYIRRDGTVTLNPLKQTGRLRYPFECEYHSYRPDGRYSHIETGHHLDLISEYIKPSQCLDTCLDKPLDNVPALDADIVRVYDARLADKDVEIERYKELYVECSREARALRARVEELEAVRDVYQNDWQLAVKERDELRDQLDDTHNTIKEYQAKYENMLTHKNGLRDQLTESEAKYKREMDAACEHVRGLCEERTKLRTQLATETKARKEAWDVMDERLATIKELSDQLEQSEIAHGDRERYLMSQLAALTQPKLVKQTWQNVYDNGEVTDVRNPRSVPAFGCIGALRRDHYQRSDGTTYVECVLEPITKEVE